MPRSTRETWAQRVTQWEQSGKTVGEFAEAAGLNANSLKVWRWRLKADRAKAARVIEVVAQRRDATPTARTGFEVFLPGGTRVWVPGQFDGAALRKLLDVLEDG